MNNNQQRPGVGVGVYIRKDGKVLLGERRGEHGGGYWAAPGGHLENGESWEDCVVREVSEEVGIEITNVRYMGLTNDIFASTGKHYVTIAMVADWVSGVPEVREPQKCARWEWFTWDSLPNPLFTPTINFVSLGINPLEFKG